MREVNANGLGQIFGQCSKALSVKLFELEIRLYRTHPTNVYESVHHGKGLLRHLTTRIQKTFPTREDHSLVFQQHSCLHSGFLGYL